MPKAAWISIPEYAKQIGMTPQYIRRIIKAGKITERSLKPNGKRFLINPKKADRELAANTSHVNKKPTVEQSGKSETETKKTKPESVSIDEQNEIIKSAGIDDVSLAEAQRLQANYMAALKNLGFGAVHYFNLTNNASRFDFI